MPIVHYLLVKMADDHSFFDNYNEYLDFRRIEFLTIKDAANNNQSLRYLLTMVVQMGQEKILHGITR